MNIKTDLEQRMQKSLDALKNELSKLRTGRAHPSVLAHVRVDYYGNEVPLQQVANITVADARMLTVTPYEKTMVAPIEKAIMTADLGLNPQSMGQVIRVPLPSLTEERRKSLVKLVRSEGENARVAIRNVRRDTLQHLKDQLKQKEITEDDERKQHDQIQKITDQYVEQVDRLLTDKEAELMTV